MDNSTYKFDNNKELLLKNCQYYKGEDTNPYKDGNQAMFWEYEEKWLDLSASNSVILSNAIDEYVGAGLSEFEMNDNTPLSLKALLFNRYCHWLGGYGLFEDAINFKLFYNNEYRRK